MGWNNQAVSLIILIEQVTGYSGLFGYSPTVGPGNLIFSLAAAAGTDPYGNSYPQGLSMADPAEITFPSKQAWEEAPPASIRSTVGGISPAQFLQMALIGPATTTAGAHDRVAITMNSAAEDNSSSANMEFFYQGSNGTEHELAYLDITGVNILAGSIVGVDPGSSPATPATWHTIALQNGYTAGTNNGFTDVPQVRMMADNKNLQFKGTLSVPASPSSNVWGLLPASFPNANLGGPYGKGVIGNNLGGTTDHIQVQNTSNISLGNGTGHGGDTFDLCCIVPTQ